MRKEDYSELAHLYTQRLVDALGDRLTAVMVSGSLATGELVPGESDLDLIIILESKNYDELDIFERTLKAVSQIHDEMVKKHPSLNWHGPRIYNEEVYSLIDHDHERTNKIIYKHSRFQPKKFLAQKDFCVRMTMRRVFPGSRLCGLYFDPQQPKNLWGWLRFHFLTTACYFLTLKGHVTSKRRAPHDIEKIWPTQLIKKATQILKNSDNKEAPSQENFWTLVEATEEIAQRVFSEAQHKI